MDIQNSESVPFPPKKSNKKKSGGFQSMNLRPQVFRAIKFKGYNLPTPIQRKVIPLALEGGDIVACSRTGSGKTAAFLIPMVHKLEKHSNIIGARALILSPTRELALQTSSMNKIFCKFTDLVSSVIVGGHGFEGQFESLATNPDIIIATPGRLAQVLNETNLTLKKLEFLVFDEADFLFEMGFAEQINAILEKVNPNRQSLLFSATIPQELSEFSRVKLKDYIFCKLDSEYSLADEIQLNFLLVRSSEKIPALLYLLIHVIKLQETSIVFVSTKYHVELLIMILQEFAISNVGIYGQMDQLARKENLTLFRTHKVKVLVVTDLAARGLDVPFVNNIIHFDYPTKPKIFIHRSGRTARAGQSGMVYSLIKIEEIMYVADISLYIGRKLTFDDKDINTKDKAIYGRVPEELLAPYIESMDKLKRNPEFFKAFDVCEKAFKQFLKTRKKTSKACVENSKLLDSYAINPIFRNSVFGDVKELKKKQDLIMEIKNYKPKNAYLELNKLKNDENSENDMFLKVVQKMKAIEEGKKKSKIKQKDEKVDLESKKAQQEERKEIFVGTIDKNNDLIRLNKRRMKRKSQSNEENKPKKTDFKHPTQYLTLEPPSFQKFQKKVGGLENSNKISSEDVNPFLLAENFDELAKSRKQRILWDNDKKKYVKGNLTETGKLKKDKEDKKMKEDHGKKLYKSWSKRHMMSFQNEGEFEDTKITDKAKAMFQNRRNRNFFPEKEKFNNEQRVDKGKGSKKIGKREIKTPNQIFKDRVKKKNMNLKNMEKSKRRKVLHKNPRKGKY